MLVENPPYEIVGEFRGEKLVGKKFIPHFDYYKIEKGKKAFEIIPGDFVTADEGTGVVTIAAYGEEDLKAMLEHGIHIEMHVDEEGTIKSDVPQFGGMYYLKANKFVNEELARRGLVYKDEITPHNVPLCWRCHTRLYYAPQNAWFVDVQTLKPLLKKTNESIHWFPKHFKYGRFLKSVENAPDWNISRSRYWGSPVPVWECVCKERFVPGSIKELEEASGKKIVDLHKPEIDEVIVRCKKCGKDAKRVPEVLDSWIEAGSASFAERHFPFSTSSGSGQIEKLEDFFPPDFIVEYTGQIRAWFYVLHVIGAALYESPAFKNVSVTGVILGTDGRKMSKNYGNYPDPKELLQKYGGDALRLYLLGSPVMNGEDIIISEEQYRQQVRGMMLIFWNVYNFFVSNALIDKWIPPKGEYQPVSANVLDIWITERLHETIRTVTTSLESFDTVHAISSIQSFVSDLSLWYVRRSRDRIGVSALDEEDKKVCYQTFYHVLITLSKLLAPVTPFLAEEVYRNLTGEESVHLADWPKSEFSVDEKINREMGLVRKLVELGHSERKRENIKVRQPLGSLEYSLQTKLSEPLEALLLAELNVKRAEYEKGEASVKIDMSITPELKAEGKARDIVRSIQEERKKLGTQIDEYVDVTLPDWPSAFEEHIKKQALVKSLQKSETFSVKKL
jgi:isoleucyl-tRNA synthetase